MRSRIGILTLGVLLVLGTSCSKPNSNQPNDNSAQNSDNNTTAQPGADNNAQQQVAQPRVPVTVTVPAGKVLTVRLSAELGSKISQAGQSFGLY